MTKIFKLENFFIILVILLFILYLNNGNSFWNFFLVPIGNSSINFTDLNCVQSWSRLYENYSEDYIIYNDTLGCPLNYPKIWIQISKFFLSENLINYYLIVSYLIYSFIFYYFIKKYKSYFFIYLYFSGVSLLLLERGNVETIVFIFLFFSLFQKNLIKLFFVYIAIILKVFPIFSLISLITLKNTKYLIYSTFFLILYFFFTFNQFEYIFENTPNSGDMSYGTKAITSNIQKHFGLYLNNYFLSLSLIILSLSSYLFFFKTKLKKINYINKEMFLSGSSIYIITFLLGSNHDYRMIFLIFVVPLIINLNSNLYKYTLIVLIFISFELHRLIYVFGFFGGILNTFSKIVLSIFLAQILIDIILKNFYKLNNFKI